jgi:hypothetical protein
LAYQNWALILLRYDYYLRHLVIEFVTEMHKSATASIVTDICCAIKELMKQSAEVKQLVIFRTNLDNHYMDGKGYYIPDLAICVGEEEVLQVEVAFSQSFADVQAKIAHILETPSILGVLLIKITENPRWSAPTRVASKEDEVDRKTWLENAKHEEGFGAIKVQGITWLNSVKVEVSLFKQGWNTMGSDPIKVCLPFIHLCPWLIQVYSSKYLLPENGSFSLKALDEQLNIIWHTIIKQNLSNHGLSLQVNDFQIDWVDMRDFLKNAMPRTAYMRYHKWHTREL